MKFVIAAILFETVISQGCGKNVLVDDFSTTQSKFFDNANRIINKLGGDYGTDGQSTFTIDTNAKTLTLIPKQNSNMFFYAKYVQKIFLTHRMKVLALILPSIMHFNSIF